MKRALFLMSYLVWSFASIGEAGPFAPAAGQPGSTAIPFDDPRFVEWASGVADFQRGPRDIAIAGSPPASYGESGAALGPASNDSLAVVSLGDGGRITLTFDRPIVDGPGPDLAVFENSFADNFLELAFVEVSSDGISFARFPAKSMTQTETQVGGFGPLDATDLDNLAGKYRGGFGAPFDLSDLSGTPGVDLGQIRYVRVVDVIGSIDPLYGTRDSLGHLVNDPFPTNFASGGFDLDGVGVLHSVPEPGMLVSLVGMLTAAPLLRSRLRQSRAARHASARRPAGYDSPPG